MVETGLDRDNSCLVSLITLLSQFIYHIFDEIKLHLEKKVAGIMDAVSNRGYNLKMLSKCN